MMKILALFAMLFSVCVFADGYSRTVDQYGNVYYTQTHQQKDVDYYNQQNLQQLQMQNELKRRRLLNQQLNQQQNYQQQRNYQQPATIIEDTTTGGYYQRRKAQRANGY